MLRVLTMYTYNLGALVALLLYRHTTSTVLRGNDDVERFVHDIVSDERNHSMGNELHQRRHTKKKSKKSKYYSYDEVQIVRNSTTFKSDSLHTMNPTMAPSLSPTKSVNVSTHAAHGITTGTKNKITKIMKKSKDPEKREKITKEKKTGMSTDENARPSKTPKEKKTSSRDSTSKSDGGNMSSKQKGKSGKGNEYFVEQTRAPIHSPMISVSSPLGAIPSSQKPTTTDKETILPVAGPAGNLTFAPIPPTISPTNEPIIVISNNTITTAPTTATSITNSSSSTNTTTTNTTNGSNTTTTQSLMVVQTSPTLYSRIFRPIGNP